MTVSAKDLVPGDVLIIKAGNKLPADVRFVKASSDAKFDRSILTGACFSTSTRTTLHICRDGLAYTPHPKVNLSP